MRMRMCMCVCVLVLNMIQLTRIPLHIGKQAFVYSGQACKLLILYYSATGRRPQCLPYPIPPPSPSSPQCDKYFGKLQASSFKRGQQTQPWQRLRKPQRHGQFYSSVGEGERGVKNVERSWEILTGYATIDRIAKLRWE